jgi:hypothetical protein
MTTRSRGISQAALSLLLALGTAATFEAQSGSGKQDERLVLARRIVELSGAQAMMLSGIEMTLPAQRAQNPKIPAEFWDRFASKARSDAGFIVDSLAPVYARRFSKAELEQLLAFYQSPVGRHVVAEQAAIAQESQKIGMRWGTRLGAAVAMEMADEGKPLTH